MIEDEIKKLLQKADETAGGPALARVNLSAIRRRANRRRFVNIAGPVAAAAMLMVALSIWGLTLKTARATREQQRIASLENQVKQLQARADAAMSLIQEMLEQERQQQRLEELEAQLASIPDPLEELQEQVDKTAFILIYQADHFYKELNQTDSAIENYNRVIELFPENRWANVARQRLTEIENKKSGKTDSKGDLKWKCQNVLVSS
jgi:tetratricopeptide (TPR) repeat protein